MYDFMELTSHIYLVVVCLIYESGTYNCKDKCIDSNLKELLLYEFNIKFQN